MGSRKEIASFDFCFFYFILFLFFALFDFCSYSFSYAKNCNKIMIVCGYAEHLSFKDEVR